MYNTYIVYVYHVYVDYSTDIISFAILYLNYVIV